MSPTEVSRSNVTITTPDGACPATLHVPDGGGPAAIMYVDAAGVRETLRGMADRLAAAGYVVLLPDVYYRHGAWPPFDAATVFTDSLERDRLMGMARSVTAAMFAGDAGAFLDYLADRDEVSGALVGTTGYCMGGRASLLVAGHHPERVGAAASFHGGRLADAENPDSPHLLADRIRAGVYVAAAQNDASFPPDQYERLEKAFATAGVRATMETYPAGHGFAVPDNATHDAAADERHWAATTALFDRYLRA
jgi:carboxymethylenebutenolidase